MLERLRYTVEKLDALIEVEHVLIRDCEAHHDEDGAEYFRWRIAELNSHRRNVLSMLARVEDAALLKVRG